MISTVRLNCQSHDQHSQIKWSVAWSARSDWIVSGMIGTVKAWIADWSDAWSVQWIARGTVTRVVSCNVIPDSPAEGLTFPRWAGSLRRKALQAWKLTTNNTACSLYIFVPRTAFLAVRQLTEVLPTADVVLPRRFQLWWFPVIIYKLFPVVITKDQGVTHVRCGVVLRKQLG